MRRILCTTLSAVQGQAIPPLGMSEKQAVLERFVVDKWICEMEQGYCIGVRRLVRFQASSGLQLQCSNQECTCNLQRSVNQGLDTWPAVLTHAALNGSFLLSAQTPQHSRRSVV